MFGYKRQKEILAAIHRLEKKTDDLYHFISSDMADVQQQLEEIDDFLQKLDLRNIVETMEYFNTTTNYISELIENSFAQSDTLNENDNLNGSH